MIRYLPMTQATPSLLDLSEALEAYGVNLKNYRLHVTEISVPLEETGRLRSALNPHRE